MVTPGLGPTSEDAEGIGADLEDEGLAFLDGAGVVSEDHTSPHPDLDGTLGDLDLVGTDSEAHT
jgi:hypothetical protein